MWEHRPLEGIYRHELLGLPDFLGNTGVPVFYLDEDAFAVVIAGVADVERPGGVPERRTGAATDVTGGELTGDFFDDIFQRMISEVAWTVIRLVKVRARHTMSRDTYSS